MRPRPARSERWPNACRSPVAQRCWTGRSRPPRGIGDDWAKAGALGSLAARLPEELLDLALTAAEEIGDDEAKAGALGTLAERLPEPRRAEVLDRAITAAEGDRGRLGQGRRARNAGRTLAGGTAGPRADGRRGNRGRCGQGRQALGTLAERLPEPRRTEVLDRALMAAEGIGDDEAKAKVLGSLAARLPEALLDRALKAAEGIGDDEAKAGALGSLAERLPEPRRTEVLDRALTAAEGIGDDRAKAGALGSLAERLPEPRRTVVLDRALTAAEGIASASAPSIGCRPLRKATFATCAHVGRSRKPASLMPCASLMPTERARACGTRQ